MEGLPRMPMLSVELKFSPSSSDFGSKFKEYISRAYQENPDEYTKEIDELNQLRENAIKAPADFTGCSTLKKYFAQLYLLTSRFPMEDNDSAAVPFTWYEKFSDMPSPITYEDVRYELACVLHNIGAVHSYLATVDSRITSDGMKVCCTHFQCATWAFQILRDNADPYRFSSSSFSPDFDHNIMDWYAILMLAQAQECILEKSLVDNRKAHIVAKVAAQVSDFYAQAIRVLEQPTVSDVVGSSKCRSWRKFVEMKRRLYRAIAYYELGTQSEEQQKMGERLAYFQAASSELTEATKLGHKESSEAIQQSLQFAEDVIVARFNQAKKENDFIYHEKVPSLDSLPELKGASLVKAIPFDPLNSDVSGGDIFKRLIPLEVHRTSSLYSEEKAKLLRRISDEVEAKNTALDEFMESMKVDQLMLDVDFCLMSLPESLIERCAAMNAKHTAVSDLLARMAELTGAYEAVHNQLLELEQKINQSHQEAKSILAQVYGTASDDHDTQLPGDIRTTVIARLKGFRDDLERYRRAHEQATKANAELHKALSAHSENLRMLSLPLAELRKQLPAPPNDFATLPETAEIKRLFAKMDEMKRQRDMLMEQLREQIRDDDVTKVLLAAKDKDEQVVFSNEMKKHEKQVNIIEQNLSAQENIVKAVTEANAKYGDIRKQIHAATKQRDARIRSLVATYDVYSDLETKAKEGIEFYDKLKKSLEEVDTAVTKWCEKEFQAFCSESKAKLEKKAAAIEAQKMAACIAASNSTVIEPPGPKLKDYMAYYRAKKAGQSTSFPQTGGATYPHAVVPGGGTIAGPVAATTTAFPVPFPNGAMSVPGVNGVYSSGGPGPAAQIAAANMSLANTMYDTSGISTAHMASGTSSYYSAAGSVLSQAEIPMNGRYVASSAMVPTAVASGYHYAMPGLTGAHSVPTATASVAAVPNRTDGYFQTTGAAMHTAIPHSYSSMGVAISSSANVITMPSHQVPVTATSSAVPPCSMQGYPQSVAPALQPVPSQYMPTGFPGGGIFVEPVAFGSNYVQLRWRYDGPKPAKYMVTFRGYQRYDAGMGRVGEREVDTGAPVKLDAEHYIAHNLHPDTMYAFEVSVIDEASGRIIVRSSTVRATTNSSLL